MASAAAEMMASVAAEAMAATVAAAMATALTGVVQRHDHNRIKRKNKN